MIRVKREAFSMLVALAIMLVMGAVGVFVVALSSKSSHATLVQYKREQAALLARSFTEFAIMAVSANDRSIDCIEDIDIVDILGSGRDGYDVETRIYYIANNGETDMSKCASTRVVTSNMTSLQSALSIIVDVYVRYIDSSGQEVTYHKRTLQKI